MLDVLSNGRMDFGVGKGGTETEAGAFDVHIPDIDRQRRRHHREFVRAFLMLGPICRDPDGN